MSAKRVLSISLQIKSNSSWHFIHLGWQSLTYNNFTLCSNMVRESEVRYESYVFWTHYAPSALCVDNTWQTGYDLTGSLLHFTVVNWSAVQCNDPLGSSYLLESSQMDSSNWGLPMACESNYYNQVNWSSWISLPPILVIVQYSTILFSAV